jgi:hypothetical protein
MISKDQKIWGGCCPYSTYYIVGIGHIAVSVTGDCIIYR